MRFRTVFILAVSASHLLIWAVLPAPVSAEASGSGLQITELLVDPAAPQTDADDEFIEFYNAGNTAVDLAAYSLKIGTRTYKLPAQPVAPGAYLTVTAKTASWALSNSGGTLALLNPAGTTGPAVTWPKAVTGAGWADDGHGSWSWTTTPTPDKPNLFTATTPADIPVPGRGASESLEAAAAAGPAEYASVMVTELLPDPASPQTDAADEFIELFNPAGEAVNLKGYVLKAGKTLTSKFTLADVTIGPGEYLALKSSQTHLALANTGSSVAVFDPAGHQLGTIVGYSGAQPGQAWTWTGSDWAWSTTPTPAGANVITAPVTSADTKSSTSAKAATTSHAKASSTAKPAKPKATNAPKATLAVSNPLLASQPSPNTPWLLFGLGALTIGYIIYEFRHDLLHLYHRLRGYPGRGRPAGSAPEGR